jgi:hypothetical protein
MPTTPSIAVTAVAGVPRILRATAVKLGAIAVVAAALAVPAKAESITATSAFTVDFTSSPALGVTASATADFSHFVFGTDSVTFQMDVTNTTSGTYTGDLRFTSLGWDTSPASSAATDNGSVFAATTNTNLESSTVSVCLYGGSNCNGGGNGGLEDPTHTGTHGDPTTTGNFSVTVDFGSTAVPPLDFSDFIGKFQTASYSSFSETGSVVCTAGCGTTRQDTPEPASMLLLGSALTGLGVARWRQRQRRG